MATKRKGDITRFSRPITIETDPKKVKRIKTNLDKLIATGTEEEK